MLPPVIIIKGFNDSSGAKIVVVCDMMCGSVVVVVEDDVDCANDLIASGNEIARA